MVGSFESDILWAYFQETTRKKLWQVIYFHFAHIFMKSSQAKFLKEYSTTESRQGLKYW